MTLDVSIGVVTGCDSFFVLSAAKVAKRDIPPCCLAKILPSGRLFSRWHFSAAAFRKLSASGEKCYLFKLCKRHASVPPNWLKRYTRLGETANVHRGFKCSHRKPWYRVPVRDVPQAFPDLHGT